MLENIKLFKKTPIYRFKEHEFYTQRLHGITILPTNNIVNKNKIFRAVLNFNFKEINFNKKKAPQFFLALELLTNQKCVATLSSKNVLS